MLAKLLLNLLAGGLVLAAAMPAPARPAATIVVDDGSDAASCSGSLTLRCAIVSANATPFTNIRFAANIHAVLLLSPLPAITGQGTWIDGYDGSVCECPRLDGTGWTDLSGHGNGLTINASDVTIANVRIVNIPTDGDDIAILSGHDAKIVNNDLGILPGAGCPASAPIVGVGVDNDLSGATGNQNGVAYIYGNTISCHLGSGVEVIGSNYVFIGLQPDGVTPAGNDIGTTTDGAQAAGNGLDGVRVAGSSDQVTIRANLIAHNANGGVTLDGTNLSVLYNTLSANYRGLAVGGGLTDTIIGNQIGTGPDGLSAMPNQLEGILLAGGTQLFLSDNLVANNGGAGIAVTGSTTQALIDANRIHANGGLPIDLGDNGHTPNGQFLPPGPNAWLAYPLLTAASGSLIQGTACPNCAVYVYRALGNPAQPGGGGVFINNTLANAFGQWSFNLPAGVTAADVSLTDFNAAGDSSEMSPRPQTFLPVAQR